MDNELNFNAMEFTPVSVDKYNCNTNRSSLEIMRIASFEDTIPMYDPEIGAHLQIYSSESDTTKIVQLNNSSATTMLIPGSNKMEQNEYFEAFVEKKKEVVTHLIRQSYTKGYQEPIGIQKLAIPELIQRRDALVQFKSGTGKTHAFLFGCLWGYDPLDTTLQYVFITSTHEVATQIYLHAKHLLPEEAQICLCIGNKKTSDLNPKGGFKNDENLPSRGGFRTISTSSFNEPKRTTRQEKEEFTSAQVVVCTMGKFHDYFCNKKWLPYDKYKYMKALCVDEFDRIVKSDTKTQSGMSTERQMEEIITKLPEEAQRVFFSATVTPESLEIAFSYFRKPNMMIGDPFIVLLDSEDYTLDGIKQYYVRTTTFQEKKDTLMDLIKQLYISQAIVFTNTIETAQHIKTMFNDQSLPIPCEVFHGKMSSEERKEIHQKFLKNEIRILISTDVTARGLDVQSINVVINFDMPNVLTTYIHRVGRSGRFGRKGVAISFILSSMNKNDGEYAKIVEINECSKNSKMTELPGDLSKLL